MDNQKVKGTVHVDPVVEGPFPYLIGLWGLAMLIGLFALLSLYERGTGLLGLQIGFVLMSGGFMIDSLILRKNRFSRWTTAIWFIFLLVGAVGVFFSYVNYTGVWMLAIGYIVIMITWLVDIGDYYMRRRYNEK